MYQMNLEIALGQEELLEAQFVTMHEIVEGTSL